MSHCQAIFMEMVFREPVESPCGMPVKANMKNPVQVLHPVFFLDNSIRSIYVLWKKTVYTAIRFYLWRGFTV